MGIQHSDGISGEEDRIRRTPHAISWQYRGCLVTGAPTKINHVGLAVPNIEVFLEKSGPLFEGFACGPTIVNSRQRVREKFISDGVTTLEFLEPLGEISPLQGFLKKNPAGGLIHLALDVVDLDASIARVVAAGGRLVVGPVPDVAFNERRIAFVYLGGQITELIDADLILTRSDGIDACTDRMPGQTRRLSVPAMPTGGVRPIL